MKRKFTNAQCAHVWVHLSQSDGRSDNMRFEGREMWSYAQHIASIVRAKGGVEVLLMLNDTWSMTTKMHMSAVQRAWGYDKPDFRVPSLGPKPDHKRNKEYLTKQYLNWRAKLARSQADSWGEWKRNHLHELSDHVFRYCDLFNLADPRIDWEADALEAEARIARLRESPGYKARAAAREARAAQARIEYERRQAEWAAQNVENRAKWLEGEFVSSFNLGSPTLLRKLDNPPRIQTSQGAEIPLDAGHTLFKFMRERNGNEWSGNIRIGSFTATHISADGTLTAGCHTIRWPEIEDFARRMGWL